MAPSSIGFKLVVLGAALFSPALIERVSAQTSIADCQPYTLNGAVRECVATGSAFSQLRTGTFIAGSEAAGATLGQAIALEVATAPVGSSSGGFTFTFEPATRTFSRRAGTFGPAFSERAL